MPEYIWGRNPILKTLHSKRQVKRILFAEGQREASNLAAILQEAEHKHIPTEKVSRTRLDQLSHGAVHQGCIAVVEARAYAALDEILAHAALKHEDPFFSSLMPSRTSITLVLCFVQPNRSEFTALSCQNIA